MIGAGHARPQPDREPPRRSSRTGAPALCGALGALLTCAPVGALAQFSPLSELRVGGGYSDNITLDIDSVAQSSSWVEAGLVGNFEWESRRIQAALAADASYRSYSAGDIGSEVTGGGYAEITIDLVERVLRWVADDTYTQTLLSSFAPNQVDNRQGANAFQTGPDLFVPLGVRTQAFAKARVGRVDYEVQSIDNTRRALSIGVERRISELTTVDLSATDSRVEFDDESANPPVDARSLALGVRREGVRSTIAIELGQTTVDYLDRSDDSFFGNGTFEFRYSGLSSLSFEVGHEYSDSGTFIRVPDLDSPPLGQTIGGTQANDPLQTTFARVGWTRTGARLTLRAYGDASRDRRDVNTFLDTDDVFGTFSAEYRLSPRIDVGMRFGLSNSRVVESDVTSHSNWIGLQGAFQLGPRIRATLQYSYTRGDFGVDESDYTENRISLLFGYTGRR